MIIKEYILPYLPYIGYGFIGGLIFFFLKDYFKIIYHEIGKLFYDTLKIRDTYSRTSVTMFASFFLGTIYAIYDLIKEGFKFDVFVVYMSIATGIKLTDALSKRMTGQIFKDAKEGIDLKSDATSQPCDNTEKKDSE